MRTIWPGIPLLVLGLLVTVSGTASSLAPGLAGEGESAAVAAAKLAADEAFDAQRYDDAMTLYRDTLSPIGDKYSQHMVGWMHLNGLGVPADTISGAAWIALAAERGDAQLASLRDDILEQLDATTRNKVRTMTATLMETYGDCAVVQQSLFDDHKRKLGEATGSRLGPSETLPTTVISMTGKAADHRNRRQLKKDIDRKKRFVQKHCRAE